MLSNGNLSGRDSFFGGWFLSENVINGVKVLLYVFEKQLLWQLRLCGFYSVDRIKKIRRTTVSLMYDRRSYLITISMLGK